MFEGYLFHPLKLNIQTIIYKYYIFEYIQYLRMVCLILFCQLHIC